PDDDIGVAADGQGAETVLESEDRDRVDGQGLDRDDRVEALLDGQRRLVDEEVDRDDRVVGGQGDADTGLGQGGGRGQGAIAQFDLRADRKSVVEGQRFGSGD